MSSTPPTDGNATAEAAIAPATEKPAPQAKPMRIAKTPRKAAVATETHLSIEEQTAAFLKSGGKIDEVPRGVSGQQFTSGPRSAAPQSKPAADPVTS